MKIHKNRKIKYIDILIEIDDYIFESDIAASANFANTFQPPIRKEFKMSDEALLLYTNFINSILFIIDNYDLKILKHYQSSKSYSYYVHTLHLMYENDEKQEYLIIFRISNHLNQTLRRGQKISNTGQLIAPIIKDIQIGNFKSNIYRNVIIHFNKICKKIVDNEEDIFKSDLTIFNDV